MHVQVVLALITTLVLGGCASNSQKMRPVDIGADVPAQAEKLLDLGMNEQEVKAALGLSREPFWAEEVEPGVDVWPVCKHSGWYANVECTGYPSFHPGLAAHMILPALLVFDDSELVRIESPVSYAYSQR